MRLWAETVGTKHAHELVEKAEIYWRHLRRWTPQPRWNPPRGERGHQTFLLSIHLRRDSATTRMSLSWTDLELLVVHLTNGISRANISWFVRAAIAYSVPRNANSTFETSEKPVFGWHCVREISTRVPEEVRPAEHDHHNWWRVWHCGGAAHWADLPRARQRLISLQKCCMLCTSSGITATWTCDGAIHIHSWDGA